jgi:hypothetical protein
VTRGVRPQGAEEVSVGERRRGIELVLDRQPEIDLDELQRILARVGIVVDTDTLVEDLDALGFDVDDDPTEAVPEPSAGPTLEKATDEDEEADDDEDPEAAPADVEAAGADDEAAGADDEADAFADPAAERRPSFVLPPPGADDDEAPAEGSWSRQSMMVAAAVVVVVIIVAVFLAGGSDDDGEDTATGDDGTTETVQAGGPEATPTAPTEPVRVAPEGPGSDPALDGPETRTDDFERGEIGDFPDVGTWELLSGEWANTDGNLDVTGVPDESAAVAAVDVGSADVRAQVQVDRRASTTATSCSGAPSPSTPRTSCSRSSTARPPRWPTAGSPPPATACPPWASTWSETGPSCSTTASWSPPTTASGRARSPPASVWPPSPTRRASRCSTSSRSSRRPRPPSGLSRSFARTSPRLRSCDNQPSSCWPAVAGRRA